ncbi:MAG: hypothetical protein L6Q92_10230 [Phycisphaerae bacterium]|nr:hypothetical protein [Phycisphaerae bacterium]
MRIERWIYAAPCVVRVEVDAAVPDANPSELRLTPATIRHLDEPQDKADRGLVHALATVGDVDARQSAGVDGIRRRPPACRQLDRTTKRRQLPAPRFLPDAR